MQIMQTSLQIRLLDIVSQLMSNPMSNAFLQPYEGDPYYDSVIKDKMDLSTIKGKLESLGYQNHSQFFNDLQLIWKNCQFFNQKGSIIYKQSQYFENICQSLKQVVESEFNLNKKHQKKKKQADQFDYKLKNKPSDDAQRLRFTHALKNVEQDQLIKILNFLAQVQPEVLSKENDELIIDVKKLDFSTCEQINLL